jgi:hypothetical protein
MNTQLNHITDHGTISIPKSIIAHADTIKLDNYKTNTPKTFQKVSQVTQDGLSLMKELGKLVDVPAEKLDYVYFSVCKGAVEHVDELPEGKFTDTTFVIPVILPKGKSIITALNEQAEVSVGKVYEFDHTQPHSMILEDNESGCTVLMVAILQ